MGNIVGRGGKRVNAGRARKDSEDEYLISNWFQLVLKALDFENVNIKSAHESLISELESLTSDKRREIWGKESVELGKLSAWYSYEKGQRRPHRDTLLNLDRFIVFKSKSSTNKNPGFPIRWTIKRAGSVTTAPVFAWSPFSRIGSTLDTEEQVIKAAQVHAHFYKELVGRAEGFLIQDGPLEMLNVPAPQPWPPVLLIPKELVEGCNKHKDLPFPYLYKNVPFNLSAIELFERWSLSLDAHTASGDIWMNYLIQDLDPFFRFSFFYDVADPETSKELEREILGRRIREYSEKIEQ